MTLDSILALILGFALIASWAVFWVERGRWQDRNENQARVIGDLRVKNQQLTQMLARPAPPLTPAPPPAPTPPAVDPTESTRLLLHEFGKILVDVLHGTPSDADDDEFPDTPDDPNAFTVIEEPEVEWMDLDDYDELEGRVGGITLPRDLVPDEIDVDIEIDPDMG